MWINIVRPLLWIARNWLWLSIAIVLLVLASFLLPGVLYFWSYIGFRVLFHENLGFGAGWASLAALICASFYAVVPPFTLRWLVTGHKPIRSLVALLIIFGSAPVLHALLDSNFNQKSGESQKWYVIGPSGEYVLRNSGGYDDQLGVERRRLTPQIATAIERRNLGLLARRIDADPRKLDFFERPTGRPLIWFSKAEDGRVSLFNGEGFDPKSGILLLPVTREIISEAISSVEAAEQRSLAEAAAAIRHARETELARVERLENQETERKRQEVTALFRSDSFVPGSVLVGVKPRRHDDPVSVIAARQIEIALARNLHRRGLISSELSPEAYISIYYVDIMNGSTAILDQTGLSARMQAGVFALVDAACKDAVSVLGVTTCTINVDLRIVKLKPFHSTMNHWIETGVGTNQDDALSRSATLWIDRHPDVVDKL